MPTLASIQQSKTAHVLAATGTPAAFAWTVSDGRYQVPRHIRFINRKLTDLAAGRIKRLMLFCPPRHGKSELISKHYPPWYLGTFPDRRVMLTSYEATFASTFGRKARDILEQNGHWFGVRVSNKSAAADNWEIEGRNGGMVTAGIGGPLTGKGCNLLIIDDPVKNAEESFSPTIREKHWDWFQSTAYTRIEPDGSVLVMMTRWHPEDLAGKILQEHPEEWEVVSLPALALDDDPMGRAPGEALWPSRWPRDKLLKTQSNLDTYWWNSLYMQQPSRHGRFEWPDEYFGDDIWCHDWPQRFELRYIAVDPSKGKDSRKGDYSAIVFIGVTDGKVYVDADISRRPVDQIVQNVIAMQGRYHALGIGVESNAFQELISPEISRVAAEQGGMIPLPLYSINNTVNKELRIGRLGPYLSRKELIFRDTPGNRLLVSQLKEFPNGDHDDGPDGLEMAIRLGMELQGQAVANDGMGDNLLTESY